MMKKILASVICVSSIAMISTLIIAGARSYADSTKQPEVPSIYDSAKPASFPGSVFTDSMTSNAVDGDALNQSSTANAYMIPSSCVDDNTNPGSMIYMKSGSNSLYTITSQTYGAGQAATQYDKYLDSLSKCGMQISNATKGSIQYVSWNGGYMMNEGDAIVSITTTDTSKQQDIGNKVMEAMDSLMSKTDCLATDPSNDSPYRSFYYDAKSYTGLTQQEQVSSTEKTVSLSLPQNLRDAGSIDNLYTSPTIRSVPESPLPANMKASLPSSPTKPVVGQEESAPLGIDTIDYQVKDINGPGCGWKWSGQSAPTFDQSALTAKYKQMKTSAIQSLDQRVLSYNSWASSYSLSTLWSMTFIDTWNQYTQSVNQITDSWNKLDAGRNAFKPTWTAYIQSLYSWETGRLQRQTDSDNWNTTIQDCITAQSNTWRSQQTDPNATPSDTQNNQWKTDCESENQKPDSLNSTYPSEPSAPAIPSDITIPSSWTTRDAIIKQADSDYSAAQAKKKAADDAANAQADADADQKKSEDDAKSSASPSPSPSPSSPSPTVSASPSPSLSGSAGNTPNK